MDWTDTAFSIGLHVDRKGFIAGTETHGRTAQQSYWSLLKERKENRFYVKMSVLEDRRFGECKHFIYLFLFVFVVFFVHIKSMVNRWNDKYTKKWKKWNNPCSSVMCKYLCSCVIVVEVQRLVSLLHLFSINRSFRDGDFVI